MNKAIESSAGQLISTILGSCIERRTFDSMSQWFTDFNQTTRSFENTIDRAILGGRVSQNLGFAFASGYQSAIESLFVDSASGAAVPASSSAEKYFLSSLCVTESEGNHPRAIETRLYQERGQLFVDGHKQFISGAGDAQLMYVACLDQRQGKGIDDKGRPKLKVVVIPTDVNEVKIEPMPALGFIPEVSHGKVQLDQVSVSESQVLDGDGYINYVKAFRSYEDLHVLAAVAGYRLGEAIDGDWGQPVIESHLSVLLSMRSLSAMNLNSPAAHIMLSAVRAQLATLIEDTNKFFEANNLNAFRNWQRDQVLLKVASKAHKIRTDRAWQNFLA